MEKIKVIEAGIDYDAGIKRFANKPELYEKFLVKFFDDPTFSELEISLRNNEYDQAFKQAHTLKGMSGNLSMTAFYECICILVEALRERSIDQTDALYLQLVEIYYKAKQAIL